MLFPTKYESNLILHDFMISAPLPLRWVEGGGGVGNIQKGEAFLLRISLGNVNAQLLLAGILKFTISVLEKNF